MPKNPVGNSAYSKHKDDIEIIAINDTSESLSTIESFRDSEELTFPVAKVSSTSDLAVTHFPTTGYPTTVIIDRYGVIVAIIVGYIPTEAGWNQLFEDVTGDDYKQKLMNSSDIAYYRSLKDE